jgi:hypothetical protein
MSASKVYGLQVVHTVRTRERQVAEGHFSAKQRMLQTEQQTLDALENALTKMKKLRQDREERWQQSGICDSRHGDGIRGDLLSSASNYLLVLRERENAKVEQIVAQRNKVGIAEKNATVAKGDMLAAYQQLKLIDRHKEKWQKGEKREEDRKEEELLDEIRRF